MIQFFCPLLIIDLLFAHTILTFYVLIHMWGTVPDLRGLSLGGLLARPYGAWGAALEGHRSDMQ